MVDIFKQLVTEEEGQGMAEYALILAGVAVVVIAVIMTLGDTIANFFQDDVISEFDTGTETETETGT
ncbi:Flp family type IVb pilin [Alkalicoccus halolimnae]|uniref:Flp family type IVb pilin n=1 Tax=Alkalicoccus halolimnae TaxID=1667239 RepID=A0A5C7F7U0_9BACI|nr:Flp family type IVb pilin [Alkalicoccus halolimnae]TXF86103.1 Flp family type IVb pilin [Alkalicoccus halolimnae]